jgi:thymidylate synthase ThyX
MLTIQGKYGIKATILADSINKAGVRFLTFEIEYPRIVLAELNTHKMLSKNSFSSRAVPFKKMVEQLNGRPVRFGANQAGMQDQGVDFNAFVDVWEHSYGEWRPESKTPEEAWESGKEAAIELAESFSNAGYHKQVYNRLLEPWQMMKTVISATEWENFFWLRDHSAADPSLAELARVMNEARKASTPVLLEAGEWHLPYVDWYFLEPDEMKPEDTSRQVFFLPPAPGGDEATLLTLEQAIKISCARCAAVSYRNEGYGLEKSLEVYDRLVGDEKKHASAFEHCAKPIAETDYDNGVGTNIPGIPSTWEEGITHMDRNHKLWSGNLKGWIQYRKLIPGENYVGPSA